MGVRRTRRWGLALILAATATLALPASALALSNLADPTWGATGKVYAMARVGNTLFIGGSFRKLLSPDGTERFAKMQNLAAIDMTSGKPITTWHPEVTSAAKAEVRSLAVSADGATLYIGGRFDAIDGVPFVNLASMSTDTRADVVNASFDPMPNKAVHALLVGADRLYLGGSFTKVNGQDRAHLAAVGFNGSLTSWVPTTNSVVRSLALAPDGGSVFVGGHFTQVDGVNRQSVGRVDLTTGALHAWAIPPGVIDTPQTAWALLPRGNRIYIGFGKGPNYLASFRLDNGTSGTQLWRVNVVGNVESLAMNTAGTKLFAGGHFGTASLQQQVCGNQWLRGLLSVNPATGQIDCSWLPQLDPHGANYTGAWCMLITDSQLWVGGLFDHIGGVVQRDVARFTL